MTASPVRPQRSVATTSARQEPARTAEPARPTATASRAASRRGATAVATAPTARTRVAWATATPAIPAAVPAGRTVAGTMSARATRTRSTARSTAVRRRRVAMPCVIPARARTSAPARLIAERLRRARLGSARTVSTTTVTDRPTALMATAPPIRPVTSGRATRPVQPAVATRIAAATSAAARVVARPVDSDRILEPVGSANSRPVFHFLARKWGLSLFLDCYGWARTVLNRGEGIRDAGKDELSDLRENARDERG